MKMKKLLATALSCALALSALCAVGCQKENDPTPTLQECTSPRGHVFVNGICSVCNVGPIFPQAPSSISYQTPNTEKYDGTEYNRYQCAEGYYEFEIGAEGCIWVAFSVQSAGQYALYSVSNTNNVTATRYDASIFYIPPTGENARILENGQFYSSVNCGNMHFNREWRATYALRGNSGDIVRVRFVKIDEPQWAPSYIYETIYPNEINGKKAPEAENGKKLQPVPYNSEYFYDETLGYYRMGTSDKPGEIIYAAITMEPERLLQGASFATINDEGNNLSLPYGVTEDGDNLIYDYSKFIPNNGGDVNAEHDLTANCYENYVNSDGVYPVNKELCQFLSCYVKKNTPHDLQGETDKTILANAWLAPCYYYDTLIEGTQEYPYQVSAGEYVLPQTFGYVYYTAKHTNADAPTEKVSYTISTTCENAFLYINDVSYKGAFSVTFETDGVNGVNFYLGTTTGMPESYTFTITETTENNATA